MAENKLNSPPPVLDCARVLQYLILEKGIEFAGPDASLRGRQGIGRSPMSGHLRRENDRRRAVISLHK